MEITSALWSAVAATSSAVTALLVWRIQRQNLVDAVRPEIVLAKLSRKPKTVNGITYDTVLLESIRNIGRGNAFSVILNCMDGEKNTFWSGTRNFMAIASNQEIEINQDIILSWSNVNGGPSNHKKILLPFEVYCWDLKGNRHCAKMFVAVKELDSRAPDPYQDESAELRFLYRTVTSDAVWKLEIFGRIQKLLKIGPYRTSK